MERLLHVTNYVCEDDMLTIESTADCGQTPRILFLLEELGAPYELTVRPDCYFMKWDGRPGPRIVDGERRLHLGLTAFRHLARTRGDGRLLAGTAEQSTRIEQWIDEAWVAFGVFVVVLLNARRTGERADLAEHVIKQTLTALEDSLATEPFAVGTKFSAADCALSVVGRLASVIDMTPFPRVTLYADELAKRPAFRRAERALAGIATPDDVVDFWFDGAIESEDDIPAKIRRWFLDGSALDAEIGARFGATVDAAIEGKLADWAESPRGALALVLVLDQLSRHTRRGTAEAFAGDSLAIATTLDGVSRGILKKLATHEERHFFLMPLHHAEDLELQRLSARLTEENAACAPPHLALMVSAGREQVVKWLNVIERFGRFPHRNEVLGRASTPEELAFLETFMAGAPPQLARQIAAPSATGSATDSAATHR